MGYRFDTPLLPGAYHFGNRGLGVLANQIPSTGTSGPSLLYNDIGGSDPAGTEYMVRILSRPSSGTLFVNEDGSFSFTGAPDGLYTGNQAVYKSGVNQGTTTYTLQIGAINNTVNGNIGLLNLTGPTGQVVSTTAVIANGPGSINYSGPTGTVSQPTTINGNTGVMTYVGLTGTVTQSTPNQINAGTGVLSLTGNQASVVQPLVINSVPGVMTLSGPTALIVQPQTVQANTGVLSLTGRTASVSQPLTIQFRSASLSLTGQQATVEFTTGVTVVGKTGVFHNTGLPAIVKTTNLADAATYSLSDTNYSNAQSNRWFAIIDGLPGVEMRLHKFNIPMMSIRSTELLHKGDNMVDLPGDTFYIEPIEVQFLIDSKYNNFFEAYRWLRSNVNAPMSDFRDVTIMLLDNQGNPQGVQVTYKDCYPLSLSQLDLDSDGDTHDVIGTMVLENNGMDMTVTDLAGQTVTYPAVDYYD